MVTAVVMALSTVACGRRGKLPNSRDFCCSHGKRRRDFARGGTLVAGEEGRLTVRERRELGGWFDSKGGEREGRGCREK